MSNFIAHNQVNSSFWQLTEAVVCFLASYIEEVPNDLYLFIKQDGGGRPRVDV